MNAKLKLFEESMTGKKVAVLGIGISNTPLIRYLVQLGAEVTAFDKKTADQLGEIYEQLNDLGIQFSLGENYLNNIHHEIVFKTPGMRFDIPELLKAKEEGSIITSEMEIFFDLCPAQIIGVTGSDGKTTTTTLIYKMLVEEGYTCWLGGNIGKPLLSEIEKIQEDHKVVLELSSFQLHTMNTSPDIAVITNITPNHLDMHKSMEEYIEAKKNIFLNQSNISKLVINYDNDITRSFEAEAKGNVTFFSMNSCVNGAFVKNNLIYVKNQGITQSVLNINDIIIPGMHNIENYMTAICAVWHMVSEDSIKKVARTFTGVEHRIELVREINGVKYYNSSIDSSPNRSIATLRTFNQKVILIAGGKDKNIPYDDLGKHLVDKVKCLILIGPTASKIEQSLKDEVVTSGMGSDIPVFHCTNYNEVVKTAHEQSKTGDIVVLSPASTSFDMFKNFEERGNTFKDLVNAL